MGIYSEYLDRAMGFDELAAERKVQLKRIQDLRGGRDILVYAANVNVRVNAPIAVEYADLLPINDQLANLSGESLDFLVETPGGSGEIAEDIVKLLRNKYSDVAALVPGVAKSAGTIMVMAADEILMEPASALGPIDAQIQYQGKQFSAEALIEGINDIKDEVAKTGQLNLAYLPILQQISPGEIRGARNALEFARCLVREWLATYKFKNWQTHHDGSPVTDAEREQRADDIAQALANHTSWLTHGRSIKIADLEAMQLKITDYSADTELHDAIRRYHKRERAACRLARRRRRPPRWRTSRATSVRLCFTFRRSSTRPRRTTPTRCRGPRTTSSTVRRVASSMTLARRGRHLRRRWASPW